MTAVNARQRVWERTRLISSVRRAADKTIISKLLMGVGITEVDSRPGIGAACAACGLIGSTAFDFRTGSDFNGPEHRVVAIQLSNEEEPVMLRGNPPCTNILNLPNFNLIFRGDECKKNFYMERDGDIGNLQLCCKLNRLQRKLG